jgi:hypothetical protein
VRGLPGRPGNRPRPRAVARPGGWSIDGCQTAALVTSALDMAIRNRAASPGVLIHRSRVQYTSSAFTDRARATRATGLLPSMGSIGDCYDSRQRCPSALGMLTRSDTNSAPQDRAHCMSVQSSILTPGSSGMRTGMDQQALAEYCDRAAREVLTGSAIGGSCRVIGRPLPVRTVCTEQGVQAVLAALECLAGARSAPARSSPGSRAVLALAGLPRLAGTARGQPRSRRRLPATTSGRCPAPGSAARLPAAVRTPSRTWCHRAGASCTLPAAPA